MVKKKKSFISQTTEKCVLLQQQIKTVTINNKKEKKPQEYKQYKNEKKIFTSGKYNNHLYFINVIIIYSVFNGVLIHLLSH